MKNLIILHGLDSGPDKNWYRYLQANARERGYSVFLDQLPEPGRPNLELSFNLVKKNIQFTPETCIVGHSSGAVLALGILQKLHLHDPIKKAIIVGGFVDLDLTDYLFQEVSRDQYAYLFPTRWDWEKIKRNCKEFIIFHSSDDPFVPLNQAKRLESFLTGQLVVIPNRKHFSISTVGEQMHEFPELLHLI